MKTGGDNVFEGRAYAFTFYSFDIIYRFQLSEGEGGVEGSRNPATLTAGVTVIADCWQMVLPCGWRRCGSPSIDVWQISEEIDKRACLFFCSFKIKANSDSFGATAASQNLLILSMTSCLLSGYTLIFLLSKTRSTDRFSDAPVHLHGIQMLMLVKHKTVFYMLDFNQLTNSITREIC